MIILHKLSYTTHMVDRSIGFDSDRPLRWLFLDLNSYFASVEQAEDPSLVGKPVAVCPSAGDGATIIAASYEAKAFKVKTGTKVGEAKQLCPEITLISATPALYVHYHKKILEVVEQSLPIHKVCSIDELKCRLIGDERNPDQASMIAKTIKANILNQIAPNLTCSIGIATNSYLAKIGTELQKPDGLVLIEQTDLPTKLLNLELTTFTGINRAMQARLNAHGIFNSTDLLNCSAKELRIAFGSKIGERWWYLLRGYDMNFDQAEGKSLGHSNVLAPEFRTDQGARDILLRLIHKACSRLRANEVYATHLSVSVRGYKKSWNAESRIAATQDALAVTERVLQLWERRDFESPQLVGITFTGLKKPNQVTRSLFDDDTTPRENLGFAVDEVNQKFGKNSIYLASLTHTKDRASEKIAFNKTWLFSEGKGDHEFSPKSKSNPHLPEEHTQNE